MTVGGDEDVEPSIDWAARWRGLQELLGYEFTSDGRKAMIAAMKQAQEDKPLGEFFEAIVGAVYEDGGIGPARAVARKLLEARVDGHLDPEQQILIVEGARKAFPTLLDLNCVWGSDETFVD